MEIRDYNLLDILLKAEFDRVRRHKLHLSCIMLRISELDDIRQKQGADFLESVLEASLKLLSGMVRSSDIIARYADNKLLVVLPMESADSASYVAQRVHRVFTLYSFSKGTASEKVTLSMGISSSSDRNVNSTEDLLRGAETALNLAMEKGGDTLCLWRDLA